MHVASRDESFGNVFIQLLESLDGVSECYIGTDEIHDEILGICICCDSHEGNREIFGGSHCCSCLGSSVGLGGREETGFDCGLNIWATGSNCDVVIACFELLATVYPTRVPAPRIGLCLERFWVDEERRCFGKWFL